MSHSLCGPECRYRALYEGAQASLSDMAAKQAAALGRHGRLRMGVIAALRATLPRQFGELEVRIASRMSDVDDESLLAYVGYLLEQAVIEGRMGPTTPQGLDELRAALVAAGYQLADDADPTSMAAAVAHGLPASPEGAAQAPAAPAQTAQVPTAQTSHSTVTPEGVSAPPAPVAPAAAPPVERTSPSAPSPHPATTSPSATPETPFEPTVVVAPTVTAPASPAGLPTAATSPTAPDRPRRRTLSSVAQARTPASGGAHSAPMKSATPAASGTTSPVDSGWAVPQSAAPTSPQLSPTPAPGPRPSPGPRSVERPVEESNDQSGSWAAAASVWATPPAPRGAPGRSDENIPAPQSLLDAWAADPADDAAYSAEDDEDTYAQGWTPANWESPVGEPADPWDQLEAPAEPWDPWTDPTEDAPTEAGPAPWDGASSPERASAGPAQVTPASSPAAPNAMTTGAIAPVIPEPAPPTPAASPNSTPPGPVSTPAPDTPTGPEIVVSGTPVAPAAPTAPTASGPGQGVARVGDKQPAIAAGKKVVRGQIVRPEPLFPTPAHSSSRSRRRKSARTSATPPDPTTFDIRPDSVVTSGGDLTDDIRNQLLTAVAIPRPVFTSDLASMFGDPDLVERWHEEARSESGGDVRFVAPKARHRNRGSLVLPVGHLRAAAVEFTRSWWASCMALHRGAKVYELGVLLHRVGEQVVSHRVHDHKETVLLRLNQERGVVGVVVVLGAKLGEGEVTRAAMCDDIEELLQDRLELLVVLSSSDPAFEPMMGAITAEAQSRRWQPTCPVVAARSWEYADGNSSAFRHILG